MRRSGKAQVRGDEDRDRAFAGMAAAIGGSDVLRAQRDGTVAGDLPVTLPVMAPRLQADVEPAGGIDLSIWGAGRIGRVAFAPLTGPFVYAPNELRARDGGVAVAQSASALLLRGRHVERIAPARRCAWWHDVPADTKAERLREDGVRLALLPWGTLRVEERGPDTVISAGATRAEAERGGRLSAGQILAEAAAHSARCDLLPEGDPLLRSMVVQGVHAALSSIRADDRGGFAGLAAGQAYSSPARTYFRDGYWTLQLLLDLAPGAVRDQIRLLAAGVQPDGEAPSGVILSGPAQSAAWREFIRHPDRYKEHHLRPDDWWSDHFDSPLFFVLALGDYAAATGDTDELARHRATVAAVVARYFALAGPDGLPLKPRNDRDWADNVFREGLVAYDLGLWVGALDVVAHAGSALDAGLAERARAAAAAARQAIDRRLWTGTHYADYATPDGFVEDHLTLDSLTLARYHAVPEPRARALLERVASRLESRRNREQPYGDWGVLCAFPPFKRRRDIRAKTAFAYRYHNGADWPYLDGIYAIERLRRGMGGARYPLTRWWSYCLARGWAGPVEYYAPPFGRGSLLQGWSAMPATAVLRYRAAVLAEGIGDGQ
ncbi:MAG: hypothetical protein U1E59_04510 [Amaricoccus sp.]